MSLGVGLKLLLMAAIPLKHDHISNFMSQIGNGSHRSVLFMHFGLTILVTFYFMDLILHVGLIFSGGKLDFDFTLGEIPNMYFKSPYLSGVILVRPSH